VGNTQKLGQIGEDVACAFLKNRKYSIVERNYRKKWGELDIIAKREGRLHFVEVKSVSRENLRHVLRETYKDRHRPEDNVHPWKLQRLGRTIQTFLLERNISEEQKWQFDIITVYLDTERKEAKCEFMEDIVL